MSFQEKLNRRKSEEDVKAATANDAATQSREQRLAAEEANKRRITSSEAYDTLLKELDSDLFQQMAKAIWEAYKRSASSYGWFSSREIPPPPFSTSIVYQWCNSGKKLDIEVGITLDNSPDKTYAARSTHIEVIIEQTSDAGITVKWGLPVIVYEYDVLDSKNYKSYRYFDTLEELSDVVVEILARKLKLGKDGTFPKI